MERNPGNAPVRVPPLQTIGDRLAPFHGGDDLVFLDRQSKSARAVLELEGLPFTGHAEKAAMLWMRKEYRPMMDQLRPFQLINHFPNERSVINKARLTGTLNCHDRSRTEHCLPMSSFYPETYRLDLPQERAAFFDSLPAKDDRDNLWIYKPGGSSRGRGIEILWQFDELRDRYAAYGDQRISDKRARGVIQRYIRNPLLLEGRKSEIRVYWLVAGVDPMMVLLYPEPTVRLNTLPFQLDDFDNPLIHVTNVYQQKNHPDYDPNAVLKWRFDAFGRYLSEALNRVDGNYLEQTLLPRIRDILATVSRAAQKPLTSRLPESGDCFAVFGADLILDDDLNPWLTEIQKGPGLSFDDPVKRDVIVPMLSEAARIVLEIRQKRRRDLPLIDLNSVDRYQWVMNELQPELAYPGAT